MKVTLFTGGFDPLHSGHLSAIKEAAEIGRVIVGVNSDEWLTRKKGRPFMPLEERKAIVEQLKGVMTVIEFNDSDNTACDAIEKAKDMFPTNTIVFVNGGDRDDGTTPEYERYKDDPKVEFAFGVGGSNKKNSSSWILEEWKAPMVERAWGSYRVLYDQVGTKVKELVVNPGQALSLQRHRYRSEHWIIAEGVATILHGYDPDYTSLMTLARHQEVDIPVGCWHQLANKTAFPLKIIEIQHGIICEEHDIQRL